MNSEPQCISLDKAYEVRHWTREFRCTAEELYRAVGQVGKGVNELHEFRRTAGHCFAQKPAG